MGITAQGATFTYTGTLPFGGSASFSGNVVGISVESPQAEVVDMTGAIPGGQADPIGYSVQVPTGAWSGGSVTIDYLKRSSGPDPQTLVRSFGTLTFSSANHSVTRKVLCESSNEEARVGELVRGTINFRLTDYTG